MLNRQQQVLQVAKNKRKVALVQVDAFVEQQQAAKLARVEQLQITDEYEQQMVRALDHFRFSCVKCALSSQVKSCGNSVVQCPNFQSEKHRYFGFKKMVPKVVYPSDGNHGALAIHTLCGVTAVHVMEHEFINCCKYQDIVYPVAYLTWLHHKSGLLDHFNLSSDLNVQQYANWLAKVDKWPYTNAQRVLVYIDRLVALILS